jgi:hypothetical protein
VASADKLQEISEALGIPVETFIGGKGDHRLTQAAELIRLFDAIETETGRKKVLDVARAVASQTDGVASAA